MKPLAGAFAKLRRAEEHLDTLELEIDRIYAANLNDRIPYVHYDPPRWVVRVRPVLLPDDDQLRLALIAGDAVANMRTALDYLVCDLVRRETGGEPGRQNAFPIYTDKRKFEAKVRKPKEPKLSPLYGLKVDGDAWTFIEAAQPFDAPYSPLALLSRYSNRDKHRALYVHMMFPILDHIEDFIGWGKEARVLWSDMVQAPLWIPLSPDEPTDLAWFIFDTDTEVQVKGPLPINPAFGEEDAQTSVMSLRVDLAHQVRALLDEADRRFFTNQTFG